MEYDWVGKFNNGLAIVKSNGKYGLINNNKEIVIGTFYDWMMVFHEKIVIVRISNDYSFITIKNNKVVSILYDRRLFYYKNNFIKLSIDKTIYFLDVLNNYKEYKFNNKISNIGSENNRLYYEKYNDSYIITIGSFVGKLDQFKEVVADINDKDNIYYKKCVEMIDKLEKE